MIWGHNYLEYMHRHSRVFRICLYWTWDLYDWAIIADHHLKTVTIFAAHRHESTEEITKKIVQLWNSTAPVDKAFWVKTEFKPLIAKESYQKSYAAILRH